MEERNGIDKVHCLSNLHLKVPEALVYRVELIYRHKEPRDIKDSDDASAYKILLEHLLVLLGKGDNAKHCVYAESGYKRYVVRIHGKDCCYGKHYYVAVLSVEEGKCRIDEYRSSKDVSGIGGSYYVAEVVVILGAQDKDGAQKGAFRACKPS